MTRKRAIRDGVAQSAMGQQVNGDASPRSGHDRHGFQPHCGGHGIPDHLRRIQTPFAREGMGAEGRSSDGSADTGFLCRPGSRHWLVRRQGDPEVVVQGSRARGMTDDNTG